MRLITELKNNNGQFDIDHFIDNESAYIRAFKTLLKNKKYDLLCKALSCYHDQFRSYADRPAFSYRPGMDFVISYYPMFLYAQIMEKGIKGVVEPNKKESTYAYLQLLRRIDKTPSYISSYLYKNKMHLLLRYAVPDLMDRYSIALYHAGMHFYKSKDYKMAFKLFKKGADFDCTGRQIVYPYYLISKNQSMTADMYMKGLGVEKNIEKATKYYKLSGENCGKKNHMKMGDIYILQGKYSDAFLAYTEINTRWPWIYSTYFMLPARLESKFKTIYNKLNKKQAKTNQDNIVLSMMLQMGVGCEKDEAKAKELLPEEPEWVTRWVKVYRETRL